MTRDNSLLIQHGSAVLENGYTVIPIDAGAKRPRIFGWTDAQSRETNARNLKDWVKVPGRGVGIATRNTPAIDIDVRDEEVAELVDKFVCELVGVAPLRIGRWPKRLRVFRTDEPFTKIASPRFSEDAVRVEVDGKKKWNVLGDIHQVEVLGDGQQFAAYHIHPDTQRPYDWRTEDHPANLPADELPTLTAEQARQVVAYFVELAEARGWVQLTPGRSGSLAADMTDDWTAGIKSVMNITLDEVRDDLMNLPGREDYDGWLEAMMALYHQTQGSEDGRTIAHEWCSTLVEYDADELDAKWDGGYLEARSGKEPVTWRTIKHHLKTELADRKVAMVRELKEGFRDARDMSAWNEVASKVRRSEIDMLSRESLVEVAKQQYQIVSGDKVTVTAVRKDLAYELDTRKMPDWCTEWVYDTSDDAFISTATAAVLSPAGFNATYDRLALTKKDRLEGRATPSKRASELALNTYRIPVVGGRMYLPSESSVFTHNGVRHANLYREDLVPVVPDRLRPLDKRNIAIVKAHVANLLPAEDEQLLMLDWLSWVVQNPGRIIRWALLLQGVPGDGKSFFGELMRVVLGHLNVTSIDASALESNFHDWAHGSMVICVEEVKMHGVNSLDILNRTKTKITNDRFEINPKGRPAYEIVNTANYFFTSNYKNAIPITDEDRRYCVLNTRFSSSAAYRAFRDANPDYYTNLFGAIGDSGPALRKWLLEREISDRFPAGGVAPLTKGRERMIQESKPQFLRDMSEVIRQGEWATITDDIVSVTDLADVLAGEGSDMPMGKHLHRNMTQNGFTELGRVKLADRPHRFWTTRPEMFMHGDYVNTTGIRSYVKKRQREIEENEL